MSHSDYLASQQIAAQHYSFTALIMAAMRKANYTEVDKLKAVWPNLAAELNYRYWCAGGLMPGEEGYTPDGDDNLPVGAPSTFPAVTS